MYIHTACVFYFTYLLDYLLYNLFIYLFTYLLIYALSVSYDDHEVTYFL